MEKFDKFMNQEEQNKVFWNNIVRKLQLLMVVHGFPFDVVLRFQEKADGEGVSCYILGTHGNVQDAKLSLAIKDVFDKEYQPIANEEPPAGVG